MVNDRIAHYQHERERTFKRWLDGEITRDTARKAIQTVTLWIEKMALGRGE